MRPGTGRAALQLTVLAIYPVAVPGGGSGYLWVGKQAGGARAWREGVAGQGAGRAHMAWAEWPHWHWVGGLGAWRLEAEMHTCPTCGDTPCASVIYL